MLSQFFLDRHGSYGMPLLSSNDLTVIDWGPKTAKLGFLTHMQPNGDFGIWVKFQSTLYNREDLKVFLDGEPSMLDLCYIAIGCAVLLVFWAFTKACEKL